ncbi:SH3 domain-containing protein [Rossellomorea aquimaris]|uniref:SH3 domain-containing protein n=1 Tax=Rossellomorea aquimaris TaxID=189382 RepID=UPI0007D0B244|nr:SH3 domain-containing protein [Rossellomorea aquimaris]
MKKMKKKSLILIFGLLIGLSGLFFTPIGTSANSNVLLASVEWVTSQINPLNSKISSLENKVQTQQSEIDTLKNQVAELSGSDPSTPPPTSSLPSEVFVTKSSANVHSGATVEYKILATKPYGSSLKVVDDFVSGSGKWYRVELSATVKGWIYSGDVSTTKPSTTKQVFTFGDVYLRTGASTGYQVVTLIPKGTTLTYIQTFKNSLGETWYNVKTSSGQVGWVYSGLAEVR